MSNDGQLPWTEEQWATVQRTATDAARRARMASSFLPLVGPLPESQATVPALSLELDSREEEQYRRYRTADARLQVDDDVTLKLTTLACEVFIKTQQANDPDLSAVRQMVSRAAVVIGRLEDAIVLVGQPGPDSVPMSNGEPVIQPSIYRVHGGQRSDGLSTVTGRSSINLGGSPGGRDYGSKLVAAMMAAINQLEGHGQYGPFGCVLGDGLYEAAHRPSRGSLVLPSDRFVPFLGGGPLLRSSVLRPNEGVIVATAGSPIDLVVATDVHVSYLQRTTEPRYVLRVSERVVLRIKQADAVAHLVGETPPDASAGPGEQMPSTPAS